MAVGQIALRMIGSVEPSFVEPDQTMWLNSGMMLLLNIVMLPFELLLITPFTTLGAKVMHASVPDITSKMWAYELLRHPKEMKIAMLHSCLGWALVLPFLVAGGSKTGACVCILQHGRCVCTCEESDSGWASICRIFLTILALRPYSDEASVQDLQGLTS